MKTMVVLAGLGTAEIAFVLGGLMFLAIMGYLLFSGTEKEQPKPPTKPRR